MTTVRVELDYDDVFSEEARASGVYLTLVEGELTVTGVGPAVSMRAGDRIRIPAGVVWS